MANYKYTIEDCEEADLCPQLQAECVDGAQAFVAGVAGTVERIKILWIPSIGRCGLSWGADAEWTDARTPEEALSRFLSGEMIL